MNSAAQNPNKQILDAAEHCILKKGLITTSMDHIASHAGISRRTLYRRFPKKGVLLAALFKAHSTSAKYTTVKKRVANLEFEQMIVESVRLSVRLIRKDELMMEIIFRSGAQWFQKQMLNKESPLFQAMLSVQLTFWSDTLNTARENGKINPLLSNEQIMEWYTLVQLMLVIRVNSTEEDNTALLKNFLVPSIMNWKPTN